MTSRKLRPVATIKAEMTALDGLPRELRGLICFGPYHTSPVDVAAALRARGGSIQRCTQLLHMIWRGTPAARAIEWKKWNPSPYPHFAAHATIMWTLPHDTLPLTRNGVLARRRVARLRSPPPAPVRERERPPLPDVILL